MGKQTAKQYLDNMYVNEANFQYILQTRKINGSLYTDIKRYGDMRVCEEVKMNDLVSKDEIIDAFISALDRISLDENDRIAMTIEFTKQLNK